MNILSIPGIWLLLAKTLAAAALGSFLFGAAVSSMAMFDLGIDWRSIIAGATAMAISMPVFLLLGLAWITFRARVIRRQANLQVKAAPAGPGL